MKKIFLLILLLIFATIFAENIDEFVNGPIRGYTFTPQAKTFSFGMTFASYSADSFWAYDGDEVSYGYYYWNEISPTLYRKLLYIRPEYAINQRVSFFVNFPIVLEQKFEANPALGYEDYYYDLTGQTGIGDITVGMNVLASRNKNYRIAIGTDYMLKTGSSPYDINENEFSSTGSGHTAQDFFFEIDIKAESNFYISSAINYRFNNEATFTYEGESWKEKEGNEFYANGRFTFNVSPKLSIAASAYYSISAKDRVDVYDIEDSESSIFFISPIVGYQILMTKYKFNLGASYRFEIAGKNYAKSRVIKFGISIFK